MLPGPIAAGQTLTDHRPQAAGKRARTPGEIPLSSAPERPGPRVSLPCLTDTEGQAARSGRRQGDEYLPPSERGASDDGGSDTEGQAIRAGR